MELARLIAETERVPSARPEFIYLDYGSLPAPLLEILDKSSRPGGKSEPLSVGAKDYLKHLIETQKSSDEQS